MIKLIALANVKETTQTWLSTDNFQVIKPNLKIEVSAGADSFYLNSENVILTDTASYD